MYKSGALRSSRGGCHSVWPFSDRCMRRDQGLCRHGKSSKRNLFMTYEFETLKWCFKTEIGMRPPSYTGVL